MPPYEHARGELGDVQRRIGEFVADLVPDGATLQLGIGGIPAATALALRDKRDLGMDFMRGAGLATEGRAIIALPSTAAGGAASRIVPFLHSGAGVITTRGHVRTVLTEWGVAELFGKTLGEWAQALIGIAHPDYREDLTSAARERRLI